MYALVNQIKYTSISWCAPTTDFTLSRSYDHTITRRVTRGIEMIIEQHRVLRNSTCRLYTSFKSVSVSVILSWND